jgi:hypothetical protein
MMMLMMGGLTMIMNTGVEYLKITMNVITLNNDTFDYDKDNE